MLLTYLGLGIILGLSMAAPPGPVNAMIANESTKSWFHGSSIGAGAMTADLIFFIIVYFIQGYIPMPIINALYIVGGIFMLYLSYLTIKAKMPSSSVRGNYIIGLSMGLTNPYQISWWVTVGISMIRSLSVLIIPGFFVGILIWIIAFPKAINMLGAKYVKYVKIISSIILVAFGVYLLYEGILNVI
ncbi:Lysine exporter protein (LYSE/YGGA) [Sulfolobus islandicus Y.G.57.14]|jgi:threonine/homoserine/homoserine lactone efflux protein|uniref:Lysine exporter protein (LYSE/YGGA) n=9 Tax=Saccharolobus islandicus TaxID=43080 RepID=C3MQW0_SACI2|nr:LysE family translocator [Sulfolobus islandicus]ACP35773.1 Lysine exporter protein (LYSE/YGGA) [Sulfolobus islandicus L.S.2.15]ACP38398.1 Lysine exporter protein (LYSE/YGGA) [Sulfolobus islandicus M.14.25]ACP45997.1 Lysine exporter protein (LYSE/YGGA) [Sulfolobus islandicus Y.G.57.14]ACP55640.1 Lysine exporter protein (LYSE/YGGA) [Sulfolobus islandicus M.16.27]ACR42300.1 Lysine exporter protein (LYSE/YGGA) [Sulfolobus islandicus M.16.4]